MKYFNNLPKRSQSIITAILYLLLMVFVLYYALWYATSSVVKKAIIEDFVKADSVNQIKSSFKEISVSGFPFKMSVHIKGIALDKISFLGKDFKTKPTDIDVECTTFINRCDLSLSDEIILESINDKAIQYKLKLINFSAHEHFTKNLMFLVPISEQINARNLLKQIEMSADKVMLFELAENTEKNLLTVVDSRFSFYADVYINPMTSNNFNIFYGGNILNNSNYFFFKNMDFMLDSRFQISPTSSELLLRDLKVDIDGLKINSNGTLKFLPLVFLPKIEIKMSDVVKASDLFVKYFYSTANNEDQQKFKARFINIIDKNITKKDDINIMKVYYKENEGNKIYIGNTSFGDFMTQLIKKE